MTALIAVSSIVTQGQSKAPSSPPFRLSKGSAKDGVVK
jgi:hypothetical protein